MLQEHIKAWKPYEDVIHEKTEVHKLKNATSFMPKQIELISKVESIARANSLPVLDPNENDLTSRANKILEIIAAAEKATDTLVKAAEGMRKPPPQPADQMVEDSNVLVPCSDSDAEDIGRLKSSDVQSLAAQGTSKPTKGRDISTTMSETSIRRKDRSWTPIQCQQ